MLFTETPLPGAFLIDLEKRSDERGFNARAWCRREFEIRGLIAEIAQANTIFNTHRGTLRGLHYQTGAAAEAKVFRCIRGAIFDVVVDLREGSPTCRQWFGVELTAERRQMLYVPRGFAQGFITLQPETELMYLVSAFYSPQHEAGIRWDDPALAISWPMEPSVISEKDRRWPDLAGSSAAGALR